MKLLSTLGLLLFVLLSVAQKTEKEQAPLQYKLKSCVSTFKKVKLGEPCTEQVLKNFLLQHIRNLSNYYAQLNLNYITESPGGIHY